MSKQHILTNGLMIVIKRSNNVFFSLFHSKHLLSCSISTLPYCIAAAVLVLQPLLYSESGTQPLFDLAREIFAKEQMIGNGAGFILISAALTGRSGVKS